MYSTLLQVVSEVPVETMVTKIPEMGIAGFCMLIAYILWKELKAERAKNDQLTDKVITNNITMQEQLKDIIEILKSKS